MAIFSSKSTLYRTAGRLVILAGLASMLVRILPAQSTRAAKAYKGPRALGLVELAPNGKAHLVPITILIDGKFYDASAYKASPVPMALWSETVYEAVRTGVPQGLFTVTGALENPTTNSWTAEGTWQTGASISAKTTKKPASSEPRGLNDEAGPPVLRRRSSSESPNPPEPTPAPSASAPPTTTATPPAPPSATPSPAPSASASTSASAASASAAPAPAAPAASSSSAATQPSEPEDKDHPVLKRGKPAAQPPEPLTAPSLPPVTSAANAPTISAPANSASKSSGSAAAPSVQLIPAISDADGPEPRSYAYILKTEEEQQYRKKMLALAADEIRARARKLASETGASPEPTPRPGKSTAKSAAKPVQPSFDDEQLRVFDLSTSNEPVLVLTARARMPQIPSQKQTTASDLQYIITLVTREDINGDFHKVFSNVTDTQHLDVLPQYDLIDAVDADGDGRGELLFRQVSDAGSAFVVYRVIGDQLWPLFQGTRE